MVFHHEITLNYKYKFSVFNEILGNLLNFLIHLIYWEILTKPHCY